MVTTRYISCFSNFRLFVLAWYWAEYTAGVPTFWLHLLSVPLCSFKNGYLTGYPTVRVQNSIVRDMTNSLALLPIFLSNLCLNIRLNSCRLASIHLFVPALCWRTVDGADRMLERLFFTLRPICSIWLQPRDFIFTKVCYAGKSDPHNCEYHEVRSPKFLKQSISSVDFNLDSIYNFHLTHPDVEV